MNIIKYCALKYYNEASATQRLPKGNYLSSGPHKNLAGVIYQYLTVWLDCKAIPPYELMLSSCISGVNILVIDNLYVKVLEFALLSLAVS